MPEIVFVVTKTLKDETGVECEHMFPKTAEPVTSASKWNQKAYLVSGPVGAVSVLRCSYSLYSLMCNE